MKREEKSRQLQKIQENLEAAQSVILVDFTGMPAPKEVAFRRMLADSGVKFHVVKNTLLAKSFQTLGFPVPSEDWFRLPTGIVLSFSDPLASIKPLKKYQEENEGIPRIKGILIEKEPVSGEIIEKLRQYNSKSHLTAECIGGLIAPLNALTWVLISPFVELVGVLEEIARKKSEEGDAE
ncbi:MAG: 50S ribosomal protein L10 [bacterium JZ-2024 1]